MSFTLGAVPDSMTVQVRRDADFIQTLKNSAGNWDNGTNVELRFTMPDNTLTTWAATVAADTATWNVDKTAVNTLIDAKPTAVRLFYVNGTVDLLWAVGKVQVK